MKASGRLSVNVVDEALLPRADYVGITSGAKVDKSQVFTWYSGEAGTPVIEDSPLVMECEVVDNYETETFDNFICRISDTYVEEARARRERQGRLQQTETRSLREPTYSYLKTGEMIGKCTRPVKSTARNRKSRIQV